MVRRVICIDETLLGKPEDAKNGKTHDKQTGQHYDRSFLRKDFNEEIILRNNQNSQEEYED
jgi:hypothetical protein